MRPLPPDIIERFGYLPDHKHRGGNEHSSACPQCGGGRGGGDLSDRFRFWERQGQSCNFWCRRCGFQGFTDDNKQGTPPDPERIKQLEEVRQRETQKEQERLQAKIEELQRKAYWCGYHDAMIESHRQLWREAGIADEFQDYWQLGFNAEYTGHNFTSPALTIPYFAPGWEAFTVQYRLLRPPSPSDKYRFQAGLKSGVWLADPDTKPTGPCLLVEGMKKAAVSFINLVARDNQNLCVVGVPSKSPGIDLLSIVDDCDPVYIALDPDAYKGGEATRLGKMLNGRSRYVRLPAKPDDLFTDYGFTSQMFMQYVNGATLQ